MDQFFSAVPWYVWAIAAAVYAGLLLFKYVQTYYDFQFIAFVKWEHGLLPQKEGWSDKRTIRTAEWVMRIGAWAYLAIFLPLVLFKNGLGFFRPLDKKELYQYAIKG